MRYLKIVLALLLLTTPAMAQYTPPVGNIQVYDSNFTLIDNTTPTKRLQFQLSGLAAGTSTFTFPSGGGAALVDGVTPLNIGVTGTNDRLILSAPVKGTNQFDGTLTAADLTAARSWYLPNYTGALFLSTLTTNGVDVANSVWAASNSLVFEGSTENTSETTFSITNPTADRTLTFPDATGQVLVSGNTQILTDATTIQASSSSPQAISLKVTDTNGPFGFGSNYSEVSVIDRGVRLSASGSGAPSPGPGGTFLTQMYVYPEGAYIPSFADISLRYGGGYINLGMIDGGYTLIDTGLDGYISPATPPATVDIIVDDPTDDQNPAMRVQVCGFVSDDAYAAGVPTCSTTLVFADEGTQTTATSFSYITAIKSNTLSDAGADVTISANFTGEAAESLIAAVLPAEHPVSNIIKNTLIATGGNVASLKCIDELGCGFEPVAAANGAIVTFYVKSGSTSITLTESATMKLEGGPYTLGANDTFQLMYNSADTLWSMLSLHREDPSYASSIVFEGSTIDAYETTLSVVEPTDDRAIDLPDGSGTLLLQSGTVTSDVNIIRSGTDQSSQIILGGGYGQITASDSDPDSVQGILRIDPANNAGGNTLESYGAFPIYSREVAAPFEASTITLDYAGIGAIKLDANSGTYVSTNYILGNGISFPMWADASRTSAPTNLVLFAGGYALSNTNTSPKKTIEVTIVDTTGSINDGDVQVCGMEDDYLTVSCETLDFSIMGGSGGTQVLTTTQEWVQVAMIKSSSFAVLGGASDETISAKWTASTTVRSSTDVVNQTAGQVGAGNATGKLIFSSENYSAIACADLTGCILDDIPDPSAVTSVYPITFIVTSGTFTFGDSGYTKVSASHTLGTADTISFVFVPELGYWVQTAVSDN